MSALAPSTRLIDASPQALFRRLPATDQRLILLLVALGPEQARARLALLTEERQRVLRQSLDQVLGLDRPARHALFQTVAPPSPAPQSPIANERPRLLRLMRGEVRLALRPRDGRFGRSLLALGSRPRSR